MALTDIMRHTGALGYLSWQRQLLVGGACVVICFGAFKALGLIGAALIIILPPVLFAGVYLLLNPKLCVHMGLILSFFATGMARYVKAPWGLFIDVLLALSWLGLLVKGGLRKQDWSPIKNDINRVATAWFMVVLLELINPEAPGPVAWFYAMRAIGFYQWLGFGLIFMMYRDPKDLDRFLKTIMIISVLGTLWGLRQKIFGVDSAEWRWLYIEGKFEEHVLFGVLRVFSFYSDAGQFGASQVMMTLISGVILISPTTLKEKAFYLVAAIMTFIGFGISGTRGALAVPGIGAILYLILSKNFKLLVPGLLFVGTIYYVLKYTLVMENVEQVARMRTALDPDNESLRVRIENQRNFAKHLNSRPFGGGVGSAGFWGIKFNKGSPLTMPTDSWYVRIWAETGVVGVSLHMFMLLYFLGKGCAVVWFLKEPVLKNKISGFVGSFAGILFANYGNAVYGQIPTSMIFIIAIPMIEMAPMYEKIILERKELEEQEKQKLLEEPS